MVLFAAEDEDGCKATKQQVEKPLPKAIITNPMSKRKDKDIANEIMLCMTIEDSSWGKRLMECLV
jgi:hypothetical protein